MKLPRTVGSVVETDAVVRLNGELETLTTLLLEQVPSTCADVTEVYNKAETMLLGCQHSKTIKTIDFASFGTPIGTCVTGFKIDPKCNSQDSMQVVCFAAVASTACAAFKCCFAAAVISTACVAGG